MTARDYLAKLPPAISGAHGSDVTFHAACALVRFGLPDHEAMALLRDYSSRCNPPWSERELAHKLDCARKQPNARPPMGRDIKPAQRIVWRLARKTPAQPNPEPPQPTSTPPPQTWKAKPGADVPIQKRSKDFDDVIRNTKPCYCQLCDAARNQIGGME